MATYKLFNDSRMTRPIMSLPNVLRGRLRIPVVGAPLFIISTPDLVIAQCKAGIVGSFPALNARPAGELDKWLDRITAELADYDRQHPDARSAPFAVNLIVHGTNERLSQDLETCRKYEVPLTITSGGAREDVYETIRSYGGLVLHDVIDNGFAKKAIARGADGLIAVAAGAGGHAGTLSPFALIQEIREWFDGPLLLSGSIASGRSIVAALAMGADMAYVGSPFIATTEANAAVDYKKMITECGAADILYSNHFSGIYGNYLRPSILRAGLDPDRLPQNSETRVNLSADRDPKPWKEIWGSGHGIGVIKHVTSTADFVMRLAEEYRSACQSLCDNIVDPYDISD